MRSIFPFPFYHLVLSVQHLCLVVTVILGPFLLDVKVIFDDRAGVGGVGRECGFGSLGKVVDRVALLL